jgi:hypothetical protein
MLHVEAERIYQKVQLSKNMCHLGISFQKYLEACSKIPVSRKLELLQLVELIREGQIGHACSGAVSWKDCEEKTW